MSSEAITFPASGYRRRLVPRMMKTVRVSADLCVISDARTSRSWLADADSSVLLNRTYSAYSRHRMLSVFTV